MASSELVQYHFRTVKALGTTNFFVGDVLAPRALDPRRARVAMKDFPFDILLRSCKE